MAAVIAAGVFALLGFAVLTSYAPDLRGARDGGAHALSRAGVGFAGLVQLVGDADRRAVLLRDEAGWDTEDLVIATPTGATDGKRLRDLLALRVVKPTLLVLPKWSTRAMEMRPGWVEHGGPMAPAIIAAQFRGVPPLPTLRVEQASAGRRPPLRGRDMPAGWRVPTPDRVQTVHGPGLVPLLETADGGIVLARVGDAPLFLLADPDLLANHAIDDPAVARAALAMLAELNSTGAEAVVFDLITAGLVESRGLLKLAFEPPFVALTIALLGAVLLASVQAAVRFGPAAAEPRAIPYGSRTLVDNIASLLRLTKRDHEVGRRARRASLNSPGRRVPPPRATNCCRLRAGSTNGVKD
jgi:hypothetical protein